MKKISPSAHHVYRYLAEWRPHSNYVEPHLASIRKYGNMNMET